MSTSRKSAQKSRARPTGKTRTASSSSPSSSSSQPSTLRRVAGDWGRYLWAVVVAVVIAALLFEFTMIWTIGVGFYMLALGELTGLWLLVGGYAMACTPAAFGLLIATGQFWKALTHSLWIGLLYGTLGFAFLDVILGAL